MGWMYYYDYYFLILVVPAMLIALWAQIKVKTTFASQSKRLSSRGLTGAQAAMQVLKYYGINDVRIERVAGDLTDHYDPRTNVIRLSEKVYNNTTIAAIGVQRSICRYISDTRLSLSAIFVQLSVCRLQYCDIFSALSRLSHSVCCSMHLSQCFSLSLCRSSSTRAEER